jgi:hypothetical protein
MNEADFYKILNVSPSASPEKIRSAHRRLVKRYHPDVYSTDGDKARANEQLRQINEAYRILSNPERRREYDKRHSQQASAANRPSTNQTAGGAKAASTAKSPPRSRRTTPTGFRSVMQSAKLTMARSRNGFRSVNWKALVKRRNDPIFLKWAGGAVGMVMLALLAYIAWFPPPAWILSEQTTIGPSHSSTGQRSIGHNWDVVGRYGSKSQCMESLKALVKIDEQAGSKAIVDAVDATTARTVTIKNETALAEDLFNARLQQTGPEAVDQQSLREQASEQAKEYVSKNGMPQRVRTYQCREAEADSSASWLRAILKRTGLTG